LYDFDNQLNRHLFIVSMHVEEVKYDFLNPFLISHKYDLLKKNECLPRERLLRMDGLIRLIKFGEYKSQPEEIHQKIIPLFSHHLKKLLTSLILQLRMEIVSVCEGNRQINNQNQKS